MSGSATCKWCLRPIVWAKTLRGNNICIDPNPSARGEYVLAAMGTDDYGRVQFAARRVRDDDPLGKRHTSHFDTCPEWRVRAAHR